MKKIIIILAAMLFALSIYAQVPEKMSYQAVVRDSKNDLVSNKPVGVRISILQGSANGTAVYSESHIEQTNENGLMTLEVGGGSVINGTMASIDWSKGPYFIKTETDPNGGTAYSIVGTSQLLTVPYALHAKTAENVIGGINETDPVFGSSIAKGITAADTANWNKNFQENSIQTISRNGLTVTLDKNGGSFQDSINTYTAGDGISITDNVISSTGGGASSTDKIKDEDGNTSVEVEKNPNEDIIRFTVAGEDVMDATDNVITLKKLVSQEIGNKNTVFGTGSMSGNTTGNRNVAFGQSALSSNTTGNFNSAFGFEALKKNTTGGANTAIGRESMINNETGVYNTAVGISSFYELTSGGNNTAVGNGAGAAITIGGNNVFIGTNSGTNNTTTTFQKIDALNSVAIGVGAYTTADNQVVIGNDDITETKLRGATLVDLAGNGTQNIQIDNDGKINANGPKIEAGSYSATWTTVEGFTQKPNNIKSSYSRVGSVVTVVCRFDVPVFSNGKNTASLTVPTNLPVANGNVVSGIFSSDYYRNINEENVGIVAHNNSTTVRLQINGSSYSGLATAFCTFTYVTSAP